MLNIFVDWCRCTHTIVLYIQSFTGVWISNVKTRCYTLLCSNVFNHRKQCIAYSMFCIHLCMVLLRLNTLKFGMISWSTFGDIEYMYIEMIGGAGVLTEAQFFTKSGSLHIHSWWYVGQACCFSSDLTNARRTMPRCSFLSIEFSFWGDKKTLKENSFRHFAS